MPSSKGCPKEDWKKGEGGKREIRKVNKREAEGVELPPG